MLVERSSAYLSEPWGFEAEEWFLNELLVVETEWIAIGWPAALHVYFDLFSGAIQTYVFCMLTMTYISNARGDK